MGIVADIQHLVQADTLDLMALEAALDEARHKERVAATRQWSKEVLSRLYEAAQGRGVSYDQMVPTQKPLQEVIHVGTNSLLAFRVFEKRFCRPSLAVQKMLERSNDRPIAYGYNRTPQQWATGPGYYVAYPDPDPDSDEFIVDYTRLPQEKPPTWPPIVSNRARLGIFVYEGMIDRLRRLSEHVTIGRGHKARPMSTWFVLTRDDASFAAA